MADQVRQPQCQRQRDQEALAAGQRAHVAHHVRLPAVGHPQAQPAAAALQAVAAGIQPLQVGIGQQQQPVQGQALGEGAELVAVTRTDQAVQPLPYVKLGLRRGNGLLQLAQFGQPLVVGGKRRLDCPLALGQRLPLHLHLLQRAAEFRLGFPGQRLRLQASHPLLQLGDDHRRLLLALARLFDALLQLLPALWRQPPCLQLGQIGQPVGRQRVRQRVAAAGGCFGQRLLATLGVGGVLRCLAGALAGVAPLRDRLLQRAAGRPFRCGNLGPQPLLPVCQPGRRLGGGLLLPAQAGGQRFVFAGPALVTLPVRLALLQPGLRIGVKHTGRPLRGQLPALALPGLFGSGAFLLAPAALHPGTLEHLAMQGQRDQCGFQLLLQLLLVVAGLLQAHSCGLGQIQLLA